MAKPRIIIADTDVNYIISLQLKFVEEFFERVELEIITDEDYFNELFSSPQNAGILIVSEGLYKQSVQRHNISHIFLMTEQKEEDQTADLRVDCIYKYTSTKEIFNEITGKSADVLNIKREDKQETEVVVFYSASGGTGKTTLAMGVAASLAKKYKRVLYINAERLQSFSHFLENKAVITESGVYSKLTNPDDNVFNEIKHVLRKEIFNYLPPFKAALMSLGLKFSVYEKIALSARKSGDYDFIVIDTDIAFDEEKAALLNLADKVVIVTKQTKAAVSSTNLLVSNVNGINSDKYIFVCNDFDKQTSNALISPNNALKFAISDYVEHFKYFDSMKPEDLSNESSIQKTAFLII